MNEREIFLSALDYQSQSERAEFLDRACGGDAALRARIDGLLAANDQSGGILDALADLGKRPAEATVLQGHTAVEEEPDLSFLAACSTPGRMGRLGTYEIIDVIGRGGMGVVLKAHDVKLQRIAAVKVLSTHLAANKSAVKRFEKEAHAAAAINHDNIVTIYAIDEAQGVPYLAMECIVGQSLQQKIDRSGPLEVTEILRIGGQIAEGLAAAHRQGLVHRDIKPANILLQNGIQRVKITDFGLARAVDDVGLTQTGHIAGTPHYMSPEQAQGEIVDHRSDLFSLGSVLYTMCTGRPAFRADSTVAVLRRVCDDTPRPIREVNPEIPEWMCAIVDKLMAKRPDDRFGSATEVAELLNQHLAHQQQPSKVPQPPLLLVQPNRIVATPVAAAAMTPSQSPALMQWGHRLLVAGLSVAMAALVLGVLKIAFRVQFPDIVPQILGVLTCLVMGGLAVWAVAQVRFHQQQFSNPAPTAMPRESSPLAALQGPARGLIWTACVNWIAMIVLMLVGIAVLTTLEGGHFALGAAEIILIPVLVFGTGIILWGGLRMQQAESYGLCVFASVLAMLIGPGYFLGWPVGIWSLVVLSRPEVRELFRQRAAAPRAVRRTLSNADLTWKWGTAAALVAFFVWYFGPSTVLIARNKGVIVLDSTAGGSSLRLSRPDGLPFIQASKSGSTELTPGTYLVEVVPPKGFSLTNLEHEHRGLLNRFSTLTHPTQPVELTIGRGDRVRLTPTLARIAKTDGLIERDGMLVDPRTNTAYLPGSITAQGETIDDAQASHTSSWQPLFNGRDLTGWLTHPDEPGNWRVEDGTIVNGAKPGYLYSAGRDYENFHLKCEVRINDRGDGGVLFRAPFERGRKIGLTAYEAQICAGPPLIAGWSTGALGSTNPQQGWKLLQSSGTSVAPNEWFPLEIIARGNHIETFVSGQKVAEFDDWEQQYWRGRIVLQSSGDTTSVAYRKLEVRELPPPDAAPLRTASPTITNAPLQADFPASQIDINKFVSQAGRFAVQASGQLKQGTVDKNNLQQHIFEWKLDGGNQYIVSYTDYPPDRIYPGGKTLFDAIRDDYKAKSWDVKSEADLEFGPDKVSARELRLVQGTHHLRARLLWHNQRLYHVQVDGTEEFVNEANAAKFLESFELLAALPTIPLPADAPQEPQTVPVPRAEGAHPEIDRLIANAESRREISEARFKAGRAPRYEVLEAESALFEARLRLADAEQNRPEQDRLLSALILTRQDQLEIANTLYAAGRLTLQELNAVDNALVEAQLRRKQFRAANPDVFPVSATEPANAP